MVGKSYEERISNERDEAINELQSQLAAQAAHIALLREALEFARRSGADWQEVRTALAIQSDDSALREWGARLLQDMVQVLDGNTVDRWAQKTLEARAAELRSGK